MTATLMVWMMEDMLSNDLNIAIARPEPLPEYVLEELRLYL
jgi:hypothetical protein